MAKKGEDNLARMRAANDQTAAILMDFAPVLVTFHKALVAEGLTRAEALELVKIFFGTQLPSAEVPKVEKPRDEEES